MVFEDVDLGAADARSHLATLGVACERDRQEVLSRLRATLSEEQLQLVFAAMSAAEQVGRAAGALEGLKVHDRTRRAGVHDALMREQVRGSRLSAQVMRLKRHAAELETQLTRAVSAAAAAASARTTRPLSPKLSPRSKRERLEIVRNATYDYAPALPSGGVAFDTRDEGRSLEVARVARRVEEFLRKAGGQAEQAEVTAALGTDGPLVGAAVRHLRELGRVRRAGQVLELPEAGD